jgi:transposase-like protein
LVANVKKRDQAAAMFTGHHAAVRQVVHRLPVESAHLEEMMQERGLFVDHSTIHRWIVKLVPVLEEAWASR